MQRVAQFNRIFALAVVPLLALLIVVGAAVAYPKPAAVPYRWELTFDPGELRLYTDPTSGAHYWFFTYTVTNRTGKDQLWAPSFVLFTDTGDVVPAGREVSTQVTEDLLKLLNNKFLEDQNQIIGDILQGRENAKEGLVIWPANNLQVNEMSVFIAGISGETARVKNPVSGAEVILRKTLQRNYLVPGDAARRGTTPVDLVDETWILR
jgi:hypothetical protein